MTKRRVTQLGMIRICLVIVIVGLVISGVTAFPLEWEIGIASQVLHNSPAVDILPGLVEWIDRVRDALVNTGGRYPFLAYGTDWLAFAHLVIATAFIGPLRDPVRNLWVIRWGMIACVGVIPLALIAGSVRGLPWGWLLLDCSFGVVAIVPLLIAERLSRRLELASKEQSGTSVPPGK
ncbi:MAG: hypothetical protein ABI435_00510 [Pseudolysinimonas sp.]